MKKLLQFTIILGLSLGTGVILVSAAPTSTIVQNLFISGLSGSSNPCLIISSAGLVATTTCSAGGGGNISTSSPLTGFVYFVNGNQLSGTSSFVSAISTLAPFTVITNATGSVTIQIGTSTTNTNGILTATDWNIFNNKISASTTIPTDDLQIGNGALYVVSSSLSFGPQLFWDSVHGRLSWASSTANGSLLIGSTGGLWNQTTLAGNLPVSIVNGSGTINIQIATGTQATNGILIAASSTNYDTAYFLVNNSSTNWNRAWTIVNASSANYDTAYAQRATTTIATKLSQLTNDPGFSSTTKVSQLTNDSGFGSSTAGKYLDSSNQSAWTVSSTIVSSTVAFSVYDATSTLPYAYQKAYVPFKATLVNVFCDEYAAATSTMELVRVDTNGTTTQSAVMLYSIGCGVTGSSTASFNSSTVPAGTWLMTIVSSTAGTPTYTNFNAVLTKQ